jgi:hypothetical protein
MLSTNKSSLPGHLTARAEGTSQTVDSVHEYASAIHDRSRRLEISLEEIFEQNEKLRAELAFAKDERDVAVRGKESLEANLKALEELYKIERSQNQALSEDNRKAQMRLQDIKRDNTAFHSENVEVRVCYDELQRERQEREMKLKEVTTERDKFQESFAQLQKKYNDLQAQITFTASEYSVKKAPVKVGNVESEDMPPAELSAYLQDVAMGAPLSMMAQSRGIAVPKMRVGELGPPVLMPTRPLGVRPGVFTSDDAARTYHEAALRYAMDPYAPTVPKLQQDMLGSYARADMQPVYAATAAIAK